MAKELTQYDPIVLHVFVEDLYRRARWIIIATTVKYGAATFVVGWLIYVGMQLTHLVDHSSAEMLSVAVFVASGAGALVGLGVGRAQAWELKFDAQKVLLQMQIEKNTRATAATSIVERAANVGFAGSVGAGLKDIPPR